MGATRVEMSSILERWGDGTRATLPELTMPLHPAWQAPRCTGWPTRRARPWLCPSSMVTSRSMPPTP